MIRLTRLNHVPMILNADLIEHIDMTPDTIVTLRLTAPREHSSESESRSR